MDVAQNALIEYALPKVDLLHSLIKSECGKIGHHSLVFMCVVMA